MNNRLKLHNMFLELTENVYYQPPSTHKMSYPCIRYELSSKDARYANNNPYINHDKYKVTVIDKDPDSQLSEKVSKLKMTSFDRVYSADNLNHFVYTIYF